METKFQITKANLFAKDNQESCNKTYFIKADDVVFCTKFKRLKKDLIVSIELYGWSNQYHKNTPILTSSWANDLADGKELLPLIERYSPLAKKLLSYFEQMKYFWEYKECFYRFEHPTIIYHNKLLNTFSNEEISLIAKPFDFKNPTLNTASLIPDKSRLTFTELFLPNYFTGCWFSVGRACSNGVEISVDLDDSDYATIELDGKTISKDELMKLLTRYSNAF